MIEFLLGLVFGFWGAVLVYVLYQIMPDRMDVRG